MVRKKGKLLFKTEVTVGDFVVLDQFVDRTKNRVDTLLFYRYGVNVVYKNGLGCYQHD